VLLLDEPTTGLDVQSSRAIKDKIIEMTRQHGRSVLVTTHDMHVAQELCDRIGIINKGELVACKPTSELLDLFSDQVFSFKVNALPESAQFDDLPGVLGVRVEQSADGPVLVVKVATDGVPRSAALYGVMERLRGMGCLVVSIQQRQQNLESVFLQITGEPLQVAEEKDDSGTDAA